MKRSTTQLHSNHWLALTLIEIDFVNLATDIDSISTIRNDLVHIYTVLRLQLYQFNLSTLSVFPNFNQPDLIEEGQGKSGVAQAQHQSYTQVKFNQESDHLLVCSQSTTIPWSSKPYTVDERTRCIIQTLMGANAKFNGETVTGSCRSSIFARCPSLSICPATLIKQCK